jgi:hypothetical protein
MSFKRLQLVTIALLLACANQMPPGGGPDDIKPPQVLATQPPAGSVNHPVRQKITIAFSEWIDAATAEKGVSLFPPLDKGFSVEVSGKHLTIAPHAAFAESTTYHIELSAAFKDLHGNSIGTPYQYVFSTGAVLDSATIRGCIVQRQRTVQPKAALFRHANAGLPDTALLQVPSYLTQTDSGGLFAFHNIRRGTYTLLAFADANNDNRLNAGVEAAFAPLVREVTVDTAVGPIELFEVRADTASLRIASVKALTPLAIGAEWSAAIPANFRPDTAGYHLVALDSGASAPALAGYRPLGGSRRFILACRDSMRNTAYGLAYTIHPRIALAIPADSLRDTIRFNGTILPDTIAPQLLFTQPKGIGPLAPQLRLIWSEPVKALLGAGAIVDTLGDSVAVTIDTAWSDTTMIDLSHRLRPDRAYSLSMPAANFSDLAGNHPTDTAKAVIVRIAFTTISAESLCTSLSGGSSCMPPDKQRVWLFTPLSTTAPYACVDQDSRFRFDSIPATRGFISHFLDVNGDGRSTAGSLFPWSAPEPVSLFADTIEARARWDVEGIDVRPCEKCPGRPRPRADSLATRNSAPPDSSIPPPRPH